MFFARFLELARLGVLIGGSVLSSMDSAGLMHPADCDMLMAPLHGRQSSCTLPGSPSAHEDEACESNGPGWRIRWIRASLANVRLSGPNCETWSSRRGGQTTPRSPLDLVSSRTAGRSAPIGPIPRGCHALTAVGSVEGRARGAKGAKSAISRTTVGVALTSRSARDATGASASHRGWYVAYRDGPRTLASRAGRGCPLERAQRGAVRCS